MNEGVCAASLISFDLATVDDCRNYLSDRVNRRYYLSMIPLIRRVVALKRQESAAQSPFRLLLAWRIATEHGATEAGERGRMTRDAILALRTEAAAAGDTDQVAICDAALDRDPHALAECARVIADAAAQDD